MRVGRKFSRPTSHIVLSKNVCLFSFFSSGVKKFRRFAVSRVAKKLKLQERRAVIPSRRSLAACRPLHFFGAINGALCGSADKWGETHGVGTYPGLHYGDGGPGAAAAE